MQPTQTVIKPIVTEKSYALSEIGKYVFRVHDDAHKTEVAQAVEKLFDVTVIKVHTMTVKPKPKRRGLYQGQTKRWKKAIVQLQPGDEIPIFQGFDVAAGGEEE